MKKYIKYLSYVIRHKWFVFLECWKLKLYWKGVTHDLSKLLPSEFIPYAQFFYGSYPEYKNGVIPKGLYKQDVKKRFDYAWLKHIHRNPHHWQYWILREDDGDTKIMPMPIKYMKEMLADWHGAGRAITGKNNTAEWYLNNKDKIKLGKIQHEWIKYKLGLRPLVKNSEALKVLSS